MFLMTQAVILAGGEGMRLRPLTLTTPKPLIQIHGKPFAEYLIELLVKNGIKEIIFLTGYLAEQFPKTLGDGSRWGVTIRYSESAASDDTGERLRKAAPLLHEKFLLMYGDNYWPLDLKQLLSHHESTNGRAMVVVYERNDPAKKNNTLVRDGFVEMYDKEREAEGLNGVDIGFFILSKDILNLLPEGNVNFEASVLPRLIKEKQLAGFLTQHPYWSLTDHARVPSIERALYPARKVLFVDRDGTLNTRRGIAKYVTRAEQFEFLPGTIDALKKLSGAGYELYLITNQPGIAYGDLTHDSLAAIHQRMQHEMSSHGVALSGIYYCPHDRSNTCECRKPKPGMLYQAAREHDIDLSRAIFVGDDERDMEAARVAGVLGIYVPSDIGISAALPELL